MSLPHNLHLQNQVDRHTKQLVELSVAQIRGILTDGSESIEELTESFVAISELVYQLMNHIYQNDEDEEAQKMVTQVHDRISQGIIAFQFYDRISQRLEHVNNGLTGVSSLVTQDDKSDQLLGMKQLSQSIYDRLTMESERVLYRQILDGHDIEEALIAYRNLVEDQKQHKDNDIELF